MILDHEWLKNCQYPRHISIRELTTLVLDTFDNHIYKQNDL
jgi:hypothetical protein